MKKVALFIFLTFAAAACSKPDESHETYYNPIVKPENENRILDLSYGNDPAQKMDLYLPAGRQTDKTKVFIIIHGGGWYTGDKVDVENQVFLLRNTFPDCAIANINYRLATAESLGFPKQINDLQQAVSYLNAKYTDYHIGRQYAMLGVSAGAHLAMLYGYKYNLGNQVKAICSIVGPADFSDPNYEQNALFSNGVNYLVGSYAHYSENPSLYNAASPVKQITSASPKTIMFYGNADPLVPETQIELLKNKLDQYNVYNESYVYDVGHANWTPDQFNDINLHIAEFFKSKF